ncbi:putative enoyl-CoA hydratase echA8 [Oxobacter pfennigii]|uniref:short-chain-enoyl-CoA hydratase n=1 Tax=Oxobacter pfennigii TaxID=36849 RepID=A0A0P8W3Y8_9CLOT|nr:short-chain-enoyl-CoA hydratase [Oxobacter pfennigii]KPU42325.1 putative enoyl-CoA hydratase echA8 [Oxobacter pfennigii]
MENIIIEKSNHIGIITISRPQALNALNWQTLRELDAAVDAIENDKDIYCVIIGGAGDKAFVAGADISEMKDMDVFSGSDFGALGNWVFRKIELLDKPVIAAIGGYALGGGCELALSCDIRIASDNAKFGQPEVSLGITPGFGGTQRLARIVGTGKAKEMIYTGANIDAQEALRIGLVNKVVPKESLNDEAMKMAAKIAGNAPIAVKLCKAAINYGMQCDIDTALAYESSVFGQCFASQDQKDAMTAFVEKRKLEGFNNK